MCTEVDMKIYNLYLFSTFFQRHSIVVHKSYIAGHADSSFPVHILYIELGEQITFENEALRKTHVNLPGINSSKKYRHCYQRHVMINVTDDRPVQ